MARELSMNGRKKIETIQREFTEKFNYLTLIFLDVANKSIDVSRSLAEVRTLKGPDISILGSLKVNTLEKRFNDSFGLKVEVAYSKEGMIFHTKETVDKTLNELNGWCAENGCDRIEFKKRLTRNTLLSIQEQLFNAIRENYPDAVAKKINKDNFVDIHIPSVSSKRGTHLFFNTAKNDIKLGFYVRDEDFVNRVLKSAQNVERYAQGLRISGNPSFVVVEDVIKAAMNFLSEFPQGTDAEGGANDFEKEDGGDREGNFDDKKLTQLEKVNRKIVYKKSIKDGRVKSKDKEVRLAPYVDDEIYSGLALATLLEIVFDIICESEIIPASSNNEIVLDERLPGILGVSTAVIMASGFIDDGNFSLNEFKNNYAEIINSVRVWYVNLQSNKLGDILPSVKKAVSTISTNWDDYMQIQGKDLCDSIKILANNKGFDSEDGIAVVKLITDALNISQEDWSGLKEEEEEVVDGEIAEENESNRLDDFDVKDSSVINYICDKIKNGKYLTNLLYVNKLLSNKGYSVDRHQAYFFDSSVLLSDRELEGFLVVNMDGFHSNCMNDEEMELVFSWSGVTDLQYKENKKGCSIDIIADQGRLTIKKVDSRSLKILYTLYKNVWKAINDKFEDEPIILWNDVWDMGIKEVGFSTFNDYLTFDVSQDEDSD